MVGHAACAFLVGRENIIASIDNFSSVTNFVPGAWQTERDEYPRTFESKLDRGYGLLKDVPFVISSLLKESNLELKDISKFCLYSPDPRGYLDLGKALGIDLVKQLENPLFESLGMTGTPHATLLLISSLMQAKPGMSIICAGWGDGAIACLLKVTDDITKLAGRHLGISYLNSKRKFPYYGQFADYNQAREHGWGNAGRSTVVGYWRDIKWGVQLYGMRCNKCQTLQYPITRGCVMCGEIDNHQEIKLSRRGKVFTFTHDYLVGAFGAPTFGRYPCTRVIVDLEDGCRIFIELMDNAASEVEIGMPVELTFRMLHQQKDSFRYYGWRARPVRN